MKLLQQQIQTHTELFNNAADKGHLKEALEYADELKVLKEALAILVDCNPES